MTTLNGVNPNMIANNLKSFKPTHPGEVLKDELEYRALAWMLPPPVGYAK